MTTPTQKDLAARAEDVKQAIHSATLEGGQVPDAVQEDLRAYAAGHIDAVELERRTTARYPVTEP